MEMSPLSVKNCKFWPILGSNGHWAVTAPKRATHGIRLSWSSPRTRDYHTHLWAFCSGAVTTCFYDLGLLRLGFEHRSLHLRGKPSNRLHHLRGFKKVVYNEKRPSVQEYHAAKKCHGWFCWYHYRACVFMLADDSQHEKKTKNYIIFLFIRSGLYSCRNFTFIVSVVSRETSWTKNAFILYVCILCPS